jgi:hypothetical protein
MRVRADTGSGACSLPPGSRGSPTPGSCLSGPKLLTSAFHHAEWSRSLFWHLATPPHPSPTAILS